jgi:hypothetical protein
MICLLARRAGDAMHGIRRKALRFSALRGLAPAPAAGAGSQSEPSIALDGLGNLHLAWIERGEDGRSRLRYSLGQRQPE